MGYHYSNLWVQWLFSAIAVLITSKLLPGFRVSGFISALVAALIIGGVNLFIRPLLIFLTFPINIITLGLFTLVINGAVLKIAAELVKGFEIKGWLSAIIGAIFITAIKFLLNYFLRGPSSSPHFF